MEIRRRVRVPKLWMEIRLLSRTRKELKKHEGLKKKFGEMPLMELKDIQR